MRVVCRKNGSSCGYFTDGKVYEARQPGGYEDKPLRAFEVTDDLGHERVIIPGEPCAHLVVKWNGDEAFPWPGQRAVGVFEIVEG